MVIKTPSKSKAAAWINNWKSDAGGCETPGTLLSKIESVRGPADGVAVNGFVARVTEQDGTDGYLAVIRAGSIVIHSSWRLAGDALPRPD